MVTSSRAAIAAYLSAMMRAFAPDSVPGRKLAEWLRQHQRGLRLRYDDALRLPAPSAGLRIRLPSTEYPSAGGWATLADDLQRTAKTADDGDRVGANLAALASALGLSGDELEVFRFVFETDRDRSFDWLCTTLLSTRAIDTFGLIAAGTEKDATAVWSCLSGGTLGALQLVKVAVSGRDEFACFVPPRIRAALVPPNDGLADVERHLIGAPLRAALALDSFDHFKTERDFMLRLLRSAVDGRKAGVNILLHGRPGTGKTEFCKTLAAALDCDLFAVGEQDEWGGEPERGERLEALQLADRLAARRGRTILLFDEMQDLLPRVAGGTPDAPRNGGSKIFLNRILEQNRVPMLWTSNDIDDFDPAFIRRMHYVLEMKPLPLAARVRMLSAVACSKGVAVPAAQADALARRFRVAPGIIGSAIEAAALAGGGVADVEFAADALARSVEGASPRLHRPTGPFVAALTNADRDLAALERRMRDPDAPRDFSLFLYGPPGTGKSVFARHLAEIMELEPLFRRGSDLLSKWIGETEQRLAAAFTEAREDRRFLIIDEAEPFLWGRSADSRSWEVSMVDELLVQMENHVLPFACTSNLPEAIDAAALRRFTLKMKFDFLTPTQAERAYVHFFGRAAPRALRAIEGLTPSDFAAMQRRLRVLGSAKAPDATLLDMLEREVAGKNLRVRKIGF